MFQQLIVRKVAPEDALVKQPQDLRDLIDELDENIIEEIAKRMEIARNIGAYKNEKNNIAILT
ncbi:MAG: chorismate mutase [Bacteroidia bacterium]